MITTHNNNGQDVLANVTQTLLARLDEINDEAGRLVRALLGIGITYDDILPHLRVATPLDPRHRKDFPDLASVNVPELPGELLVEQLTAPRRTTRTRKKGRRRPRTTKKTTATNGERVLLRDVLLQSLRESGTLTSGELVERVNAAGYRSKTGKSVAPSVYVELSRNDAFKRSADKRGWTLARRPR